MHNDQFIYVYSRRILCEIFSLIISTTLKHIKSPTKPTARRILRILF